MTDITSASEPILTPDELVKQNKEKLQFLLKKERPKLLNSLEMAFAFGIEPKFAGELKLLNEEEFNKQRNSDAKTYDICVEVGAPIIGAVNKKIRHTGILSLQSRSTLGEVVCGPEYTVALMVTLGKEREIVATVESLSFDASKIADSLERQCKARLADKLYTCGSVVPSEVIQDDSCEVDIHDRLERRLSDQYKRLYEEIIPAIAGVITTDDHFGCSPELNYEEKSEYGFTDTHPDYKQGFAALNVRIDILAFDEAANEIGQREKMVRGWVNVIQHDYEDAVGSCGSLYSIATRVIFPDKDRAEAVPEILIESGEGAKSIKKRFKDALGKIPSP